MAPIAGPLSLCAVSRVLSDSEGDGLGLLTFHRGRKKRQKFALVSE